MKPRSYGLSLLGLTNQHSNRHKAGLPYIMKVRRLLKITTRTESFRLHEFKILRGYLRYFIDLTRTSSKLTLFMPLKEPQACLWLSYIGVCFESPLRQWCGLKCKPDENCTYLHTVSARSGWEKHEPRLQHAQWNFLPHALSTPWSNYTGQKGYGNINQNRIFEIKFAAMIPSLDAKNFPSRHRL